MLLFLHEEDVISQSELFHCLAGTKTVNGGKSMASEMGRTKSVASMLSRREVRLKERTEQQAVTIEKLLTAFQVLPL
jgi:hypothetical protein